MLTSIDDLRLDSDRRTVIAVLGFLLLPVLGYLRTDFALYGGDPRMLAQRLAVRGTMVAVLVLGMILVAAVRRRASYSSIVLGLALANVGLLLTINWMRPQGSVLPLRSPLFNLIVLYAGLPNRLLRQIVPPLLFSAGLVVLRLTWVTGEAGGDLAGDLLILVAVNATGVLLVRRRLTLEAQVQQAWSAERDARLASERALGELETLRGIIPICSYCKNVRTGVGDWQQIESYVREHSQAEFSHGICPDCMEKHWPVLQPNG